MSRAGWAFLLLALSLGIGGQAVALDFSVKSVRVVLRERVLHIDARLDLPLNARVEEALSKGISIDVVIDANMVKHRWWWRNPVVTDVTLRRRIQFHALSGQYLVSGIFAQGPSESFATLNQALAHAGTLDDFKIVLTAKKQIDPDSRYLLALRARLDIETLPMLMRPLAYATPSWRLNTGWTEWPIEHESP